MFSFLKRQLKTKTGKGAIAVIVGCLTNAIAGDQIGGQLAPIISNTAVGLVDGVFNPAVIGISVLDMFLRDGKAKKGE